MFNLFSSYQYTNTVNISQFTHNTDLRSGYHRKCSFWLMILWWFWFRRYLTLTLSLWSSFVLVNTPISNKIIGGCVNKLHSPCASIIIIATHRKRLNTYHFYVNIARCVVIRNEKLFRDHPCLSRLKQILDR